VINAVHAAEGKLAASLAEFERIVAFMEDHPNVCYFEKYGEIAGVREPDGRIRRRTLGLQGEHWLEPPVESYETEDEQLLQSELTAIGRFLLENKCWGIQRNVIACSDSPQVGFQTSAHGSALGGVDVHLVHSVGHIPDGCGIKNESDSPGIWGTAPGRGPPIIWREIRPDWHVVVEWDD
jgi:hypothetical protein